MRKKLYQNKGKKWIALALTGALLAGCMAGCGTKEDGSGTNQNVGNAIEQTSGADSAENEENIDSSQLSDASEHSGEAAGSEGAADSGAATGSEALEGKAGGEADEQTDSKVASASEMTTIEDVVEEGMVPIYGDSIQDGTYPVVMVSSSSMFKIVDSELTVENGEMSVVMTMSGTSYLYLFMGTGEEAVAADESEYIPYVENADGAYMYTIPVEALDDGILCTAYSKNKEKWYDRTLLVRADSLPLDAYKEGVLTTWEKLGLEDGTYTAEVTLAGGSGKASVESPARLTAENGTVTATIIFSSPNYDYMIVNEEKYLPVNTEGNSTFEIPVSVFDFNMPVVADTVAMSEPHEIAYTLKFDSASVKKAE